MLFGVCWCGKWVKGWGVMVKGWRVKEEDVIEFWKFFCWVEIICIRRCCLVGVIWEKLLRLFGFLMVLKRYLSRFLVGVMWICFWLLSVSYWRLWYWFLVLWLIVFFFIYVVIILMIVLCGRIFFGSFGSN